MEAIIMIETSGFCVDGDVTDGATWNRSMWDKFGVSEENVSCEHIFDPTRRLWFFSDFPHLIKNLRNFIIKFDETWTPDGVMKLKHFYDLIEIENTSTYNLKANFKMTTDHVKPQYFQKMNVTLAFQLFSATSAMQLYEKIHPGLRDSKPTQVFSDRIMQLIEAMNCRTPRCALKPGNQQYQIIEDFLCYLNLWERSATINGYNFLSHSTCYGLKISLKATLEISQFLNEKCGFEYIMTLERFFGLMRNCCGCNDHPDPTLFLQMYGLVSTYSLCKPPKGSNVSGGDTLNVLLSLKDISDASERKSQWEGQHRTNTGKNLSCLSDALVLLEHDYCQEDKYDYILSYISGYVARKAQRFTTIKYGLKSTVCKECMATLQLPTDCCVPEWHRLIDAKSKGYLIHPSRELFELILLLERATLKTLSFSDLNAETLFDVTKTIENVYSTIPFVGCKDHDKVVTKKIMCFYLVTRMHFSCKQYNRRNEDVKRKTKEKRKAAKLQ